MSDDSAAIMRAVGEALQPILVAGLNRMAPEERRLMAHIIETNRARLQLTVDLQPFRIKGWMVRPDQEPVEVFCLQGETVNVTLN